jgi:hypothetical protein
MMSEFFATVNWRTTGFAIAYLICNAVGGLFPVVADACNILEKLIIAGGLVSAVDAQRIQSIVRAVDALAWRNKLDPAALVSVDDLPDPDPVLAK